MNKVCLASLLAAALSFPAPAAAAVPQTLAFSARIADGGKPVTGSHTVKFAFWDCDGSDPSTCVDPTNVLWTETQPGLDVRDGVLTAVLGADTTTPNLFPPTLFSGAPIFLEVTFDGVVFPQRMAVHSVPFAMTAGSMNVALDCQNVFSDFTLAANGGRCPTPPFPLICFCLIGTYCQCDNCGSPACPAGYAVTGGGHEDLGFSENFSVLESAQSTSGWNVRAINHDTANSLSLRVYARCCKVP